MFEGRFKFIAIAITVNIVTARVTEGLSPAITAKHQSKSTTIVILMYLPFFKRSIGLRQKFSIRKIIPT